MSLGAILGYLSIFFVFGAIGFSIIEEIIFKIKWHFEDKKKRHDEYIQAIEKKKSQEKYEQQRKAIRTRGIKWKKINDLNYKYVPSFDFLSESYSFVTNTKAFKSGMNEEELKQALKLQMKKDIGYFGYLFDTADRNAKNYALYDEEAKEILATEGGLFDAETAALEIKMCQGELFVPVCTFTIDTLDFDTSRKIYEEALQSYIMEQERNDEKKYHREAIGAKLRYDILKRDHFRCTLCGASANDGVKLHVDHIMPVSKGGQNNIENLRTLCEQCNLGKGASYDPGGYN